MKRAFHRWPGSAIFVGGRWAELGPVKNGAKSLPKWNHPHFRLLVFLKSLLQKSQNLTLHPAFEKYDTSQLFYIIVKWPPKNFFIIPCVMGHPVHKGEEPRLKCFSDNISTTLAQPVQNVCFWISCLKWCGTTRPESWFLLGPKLIPMNSFDLKHFYLIK
jgi:hypothetical protein